MAKNTIVITGGTKGLGRELSLAFARGGYRPLALYHEDGVAAARLDADLRAASLAGRAVRHDVTSEDEHAELWSAPELADAESVTLIHNAAAAFEPKPFHLLTWPDFEANLRVALKGGWLCVRTLLRPMLASGRGTVVTVLSSAIANAPKGFAAYVAAKSALRGLTESVAAEYASRGVRVFSVSPGFMQTPLTDAWHPLMQQAIKGDVAAADPAAVAARIFALIQNQTIPARGENHNV